VGKVEPELVRRLTDTARLAGRMAHDFNNILMGVMGFAELAQPLVVSNVAQRGLEATRQMHQFSRSGRACPQPTRLTDFWAAHGPGRSIEVPTGVCLDVHTVPDLSAVAMASEPLRIIIAALVQNAAEAMPDGGPVTVAARSVQLAELTASILPMELPAGHYVQITVADAGNGFRPDVLRLVTDEPLVTTKIRHRGLGLAIVLRTLHAHGGGLRIESTPGGSSVHVYLPTTASESAPRERPTSANTLGGIPT
jgi:signal transduction histidine kinase